MNKQKTLKKSQNSISQPSLSRQVDAVLGISHIEYKKQTSKRFDFSLNNFKNFYYSFISGTLFIAFCDKEYYPEWPLLKFILVFIIILMGYQYFKKSQ